MATCWTSICVASTAGEPLLDAVVAEYMLAWKRNGLVSRAEGFSADAARIDRVKLGVDKSLHLRVHARFMVEQGTGSRDR